MPTYAVLGATGSTGSSLLQYLSSRPSKVKINVYARSLAKLQSLHPNITSDPDITVFTGDLSDTTLLKKCLHDVTTIFSAVAQNINDPSCSIAQQTAHAIVLALSSLREEDGALYHCPTVVFLSSASLNPVFASHNSRYVQWVVDRACHYVYEDLRRAFRYLDEQSWIPLIKAEPPAIVKDVARGVDLSADEVSPMVGYDDLAVAMVRMAEEEGWVGKGVGVKATGEVEKNVMPLVQFLTSGLIAYYAPSVWRSCRGYLWW